MARPSRSRRPERTRQQQAGRRLLALSALGAANTVNARKPFARQGRVSIPSFFGGWLTSELPLHTIGVQALGTAHYLRRGALRSPAGWVGLGASVASWAGLYGIWKQALGQGEIFDAALREAFPRDLDAGPDADEHLDDDAPPVVVSRRRIATGPFTRWKKRYVSGPSLTYGDAGRRNQLDVWRRADLPADGRAPVLLQVHGGAWILGNKDQQAMPLMAHLAEHGWVCVSINYRLSPRATWPDHIVDVKRALAWIKDHIADHGGDPDFVAITGGSAGGHLSSLAALTPNLAEFQPGFEDADTSVVAAVPFYGVYDWTNRDGTGRSDMEPMLADLVLKATREEDPELWDHASSMTWVTASAPPFFVVHGTNDSLVPVEQARSFVQMLRAVSAQPVAYAELPGAQHAFEVFDSPRTIYSAHAVHRFLEAVRHRLGHDAEPAGSGEPAEAAERFPVDPDAPAPAERAEPRALAGERFPADPDAPAPEAPAHGPIKGNRDSMKYHVPGSQWYERTIAEEWFATVEEAEAAGFAPAGGKARQRWTPDGD